MFQKMLQGGGGGGAGSTEFPIMNSLVPIMKSTRPPSGYTITRSSLASNSGEAITVFNGSPSYTISESWWSNSSTNQWIAIELPNSATVYGVEIIPVFSTVGRVKNFSIQGSNTGTDADFNANVIYKGVADNINDVTKSQLFVFNNKKSFKHYRIYVENVYSNSNVFIAISKLQFYGVIG